MRIYRFMSELETFKLLKGERLVNETNHAASGRKSTAIGFSFGIGSLKQVKRDYRRLNGIVTSEYLLVAQTGKRPNINLSKCKGLYVDYAKFDKLSKEEQMQVPIGEEPKRYFEELCCTEYDIMLFRSIWVYKVINPIPYFNHPTEFKLRYHTL